MKPTLPAEQNHKKRIVFHFPGSARSGTGPTSSLKLAWIVGRVPHPANPRKSPLSYTFPHAWKHGQKKGS